MTSDRMTSMLRIALLGAALVVGVSTVAAAQARTNVGRGKCVDCHDHKDENDWARTRDGDGKGKQHINAFNQLEDPNAAKFAKAIGVDPYDAKSSCVKCHATTLRGEPVDGVTCESCHGPGSDYLVPHQDKGAYTKALALGMKDVVKKPEAWARDCITCHVLGANAGDAALAAAGHPTGADFDLSRKYVNVALHYQQKYTANQVASAAGNIREGLLAKLKGVSAPAATPAAPTPAAPAPTPAAPAPTPAAPAPTTPTPAPATPAPTTPAPATPAPTTTAAAKPAAPPPTTAPAAPRPVAVPPPGLPSGRPAAVPTPPAAAPTTTEPTVVAPAAPVAAAPEPTLPTTPAGIVAAVQGRIASLLDRLLGSGVSAPLPVTPPGRKTVYRGPDADLLRLQEEVIALALEALGSKPAPKTPPPQQ
jgi:hypothetical protein